MSLWRSGDMAGTVGIYITTSATTERSLTMTATVLNFGSLKGGAGKTKTATNAAAELAARDYRVLLIDLDPQASATADCGADPALGFSIGELINTPPPYDPPSLEAILIETEVPNLTVAPSIYQPLDAAEAAMASQPGGSMMVRKKIVDPLREDYDWIIIDTPPRLGALTAAAINASDYSVPVVGPTVDLYRGAYRYQQLVKDLSEYMPSPSTIPFWVAVNWEDGAQGREVLETLAADEDVNLLSTRLPHSKRASSAPKEYAAPMVAAQPGYGFSQSVTALVDEITGALQ